MVFFIYRFCCLLISHFASNPFSNALQLLLVPLIWTFLLAEIWILNACGKSILSYLTVGVKDQLCMVNWLLILLLSYCKIEILFYSD